jgi:rhamnopyranosyl-N-acetylglucosaminyl-diphospho-decaprenol beta-1,3/1,4-galactofuranosyltransferase
MNTGVCAIVVTFNRRTLLEECVRALLQQTALPTRILVVDNASTDGTPELFSGVFRGEEKVQYERLAENRGGAGGFRHGLKMAHEAGFDWFWLMDDDTIPAPEALQSLVEAHARFPAAGKPVLLSSRVLWTDGTPHSMNVPTVKRSDIDPEGMFLAAELGTISLRWASFVSVLIRRSVVDEFGLPFADYFIWNDDTEYTARLLRRQFGVAVPRSVVVHKTAQKHNPMQAAPARAYYQARNVLWMILRSPAWEADEKLKIGVIHLQWLLRYLQQAHFSWPAVQAISRGVRDGLLKRPLG